MYGRKTHTMRLLRPSKPSSANKLVFLGAQAFLTGSICRYLNPAAGFSSVSVGTTTNNSNHFTTTTTPFPNGGVLRSPASVQSTSGSSSRLFASMSGPTLTNVNKEVCSRYQRRSTRAIVCAALISGGAQSYLVWKRLV
jgi:hypothetical protein